MRNAVALSASLGHFLFRRDWGMTSGQVDAYADAMGVRCTRMNRNLGSCVTSVNALHGPCGGGVVAEHVP